MVWLGQQFLLKIITHDKMTTQTKTEKKPSTIAKMIVMSMSYHLFLFFPHGTHVQWLFIPVLLTFFFFSSNLTAHTESGIGSLAQKGYINEVSTVTGLWAPGSPGLGELEQGLWGTLSQADLTHLQDVIGKLRSILPNSISLN